MDPLIGLAARVVGFLAPLALKGAEEFAQKVGADLADKVIAMLGRLRKRWAGDREAEQTLDRFEYDPRAHRSDLEAMLADRMRADPKLLHEIEAGVRDIGPTVEIVLRGDEVRVQTGPQIGEITGSSDVLIDQFLHKGDEQRGPRIDRIG
jgi:hypothetical protein